MNYSSLKKIALGIQHIIKGVFLYAIRLFFGWLHALTFRLLVSQSNRKLIVIRPVAAGIYNVTHRFIVNYGDKQTSGFADIYDNTGAGKRFYPAIALLIGIQMTLYQLVVFAYPLVNHDQPAANNAKRIELRSLRSANSKHYLNPDGTVTAVLYATPIHSKNKSGSWVTIDTDIGSDRRIDSAPYRASFEKDPAYSFSYKSISARVALKTGDDTATAQPNEILPEAAIGNRSRKPASTPQTPEKNAASMADLSSDSTTDSIENTSSAQSIESSFTAASISETTKAEEPAPARTSVKVGPDSAEQTEEPDADAKPHFDSKISSNEVRYENVLKDTDLLISAEPYALEKWLILKSDAAPNTFEFSLETNIIPRLVGQHLEWGELATLDCYAIDANGVRGNVDFHYEASSSAGGVITLTVDMEFLATAAYPVKVDPTMTFNPSFDNGVNSYDSAGVYRTEYGYLVGKTATSLYRMLLWFDVSSLSGRTINSAQLSIYENGTGKVGKRFNLYRIIEPWDTTYASWTNRDDGLSWMNSGGTYNTTRLGASYTSLIVDGAEASFNISTAVQNWVNGGYQNYGLLLKTITETNNSNNCGFYASEQGGIYQPTIEVNYNDVPNAPAGFTQYGADHSTVIPTGGTTNDGVATSLYFDMTMTCPNEADTLTPKIEIRPVGTAFSGVATHAGSPVAFSGSPIMGSVAVSGLQAGGSYHWQAWVSNSSGDGGKVSYGENNDPDGIDIILGTTISLSIDSTYNRDGTPGLNSVNFGVTDPEFSPFITHNDNDKHAVQLTIASDSTWSLNTRASGNLTDGLGNSIAISQLRWRIYGSTDSWISFQTTPYTMLSGQAPTSGTTIRHNYRFNVGWIAKPGSYGTTIIYALASP